MRLIHTLTLCVIMKTPLLLLILFLLSVTGYSQSLCDTTNGMAFAFSEQPPKPRMTDRDLETSLNSSIDMASLNVDHADYLFVMFIINCKGEDFNYKLAKRVNGLTKVDSTSELHKNLLDNIQTLQSWTPGLHYKFIKNKRVQVPVDFQGAYTIQINKNKLHILTETEKKKHFKKNRNK